MSYMCKVDNQTRLRVRALGGFVKLGNEWGVFDSTCFIKWQYSSFESGNFQTSATCSYHRPSLPPASYLGCRTPWSHGVTFISRVSYNIKIGACRASLTFRALVKHHVVIPFPLSGTVSPDRSFLGTLRCVELNTSRLYITRITRETTAADEFIPSSLAPSKHWNTLISPCGSSAWNRFWKQPLGTNGFLFFRNLSSPLSKINRSQCSLKLNKNIQGFVA